MGVGLIVAFLSYRWLVDPQPREERQLQERVVLESRGLLHEIIAAGPLVIVDPLAPDRKVGKVYIYPAAVPATTVATKPIYGIRTWCNSTKTWCSRI
jgi:hypothetical protein